MSNSGKLSITDESRLSEELLEFVMGSFDEGKKIKSLKGVKFIGDLYKEAKKANNEEGEYSEDAVLSKVADKISEELVKQLEPFYKDTIIKHIDFRTQFREGAPVSSFRTEFISIKPFVRFVKRIGLERRELASVKFVFELNTAIYVEEFTIRNKAGIKSIEISKLGVEAKLSLLQVTIEATLGIPDISWDKRIKLANKKFEIRNFVLFSRQSSPRAGSPFPS
jgi:hypothetical protein